MCWASWRSVLALRPHFARITAASAHPQLDIQFRQGSLEPARMPTSFHAHAHLFSLGREVAIILFRSLAVLQTLLSALSRFRIHKRNLCSFNLLRRGVVS
jgi:hypothetical protein